MLVLSRKVGEQVFISDKIVVTVTQISRNKVRLGIDAPEDVPISRDNMRKTPPPEAISVPAA